MAFNDPIADLLTRIRNGSMAKKRFVDIGWSKMKENIVRILKKRGFIENYLIKKDENQRGTIRIFLKYTQERLSVIQGLKRVSKPGLRKYIGHDEIPTFYGGFGVPIISTSSGVMTGADAQQKQIGGELLCLVW